MNNATSNVPCRPGFGLSGTICVGLAMVFAMGCGGGGSPSSARLTGNTSVTVLASSTANDQFTELALEITGISLTNQAGQTVALSTAPEYIEFMHLNGTVEPITTVSIPQGIYTSATVTVSGGVPLCTAVDQPVETSGRTPYRRLQQRM